MSRGGDHGRAAYHVAGRFIRPLEIHKNFKTEATDGRVLPHLKPLSETNTFASVNARVNSLTVSVFFRKNYSRDLERTEARLVFRCWCECASFASFFARLLYTKKESNENIIVSSRSVVLSAR